MNASPTLRIRRFAHGEEWDLFEVYRSAVHLIARRDYTQAQVDAWAPPDMDRALWIQKIRDIQPFVAELDGRPVGYADVQASGYIDHFFVSGLHPRCGIGAALMAALEAEAAALGCAAMTSDVSRTAEPFFAHFGFTVVERRTPVVRGVEVPNALMRRELGV